jgi:hypothetical protein
MICLCRPNQKSIILTREIAKEDIDIIEIDKNYVDAILIMEGMFVKLKKEILGRRQK